MARTYEFLLKDKDEDPWLLLSAAIVKQAMIDLKTALRYGNNANVNALKKWFLSDYGQMLSFNHGEYIIDEVMKEVNKYA